MTIPARDFTLLTVPSALILSLGLIYWLSIIASSLVDSDIGYVFDLTLLLSGVTLVIAVAVTAIGGIGKYGLWPGLWLAHPALCIFFLLGVVMWGSVRPSLDDWRFERQLGEYASVIDDLKTGRIGTGKKDEMIELDRIGRVAGRAERVFVSRCGQKQLVASFLVQGRGGALGPHWGYIYDDCGEASADGTPANVKLGGTHYRHIQGLWYRFYTP